MGIGFLRTPAIDNLGYLLPNNDKRNRSEQIGTKTIRGWRIDTDPRTNDEFYDMITGNTIDSMLPPGDIRFSMSSHNFNLRPHDTATVAYVICFAKPSVQPTANGSWSDVQGVVNLFKKTRAFYDATFDKKTLAVRALEKPQSGVNVYPNPTNNRFFIQLSDDYRDAKVSLITLLGNEIAKSESITGGVSIDVSMLAEGVYVVRVELKSGVTTTIPVVVMR